MTDPTSSASVGPAEREELIELLKSCLGEPLLSRTLVALSSSPQGGADWRTVAAQFLRDEAAGCRQYERMFPGKGNTPDDALIRVAEKLEMLASAAPYGLDPSPAALVEQPSEPEAIAQLRHLVDDLIVTYQEDGLDRHMVRDGRGLLFSNFVAAVIRLLADHPVRESPAVAAPQGEPDAARYQWLCEHPDWHFIETLCQQFVADNARGFKMHLDAAIDARMEQITSVVDELRDRALASQGAPAAEQPTGKPDSVVLEATPRQCQGSPGECAFNKACMYACGAVFP